MAWRLCPGDLAALVFRLKHGDRDTVRQFFRDPRELVDLAHVVDNSQQAPQVDFVAASANLLQRVAEEHNSGGSSRRTLSAKAAYDAAVQHELVAPLQQWALELADPISKNAAIGLASVAGLFHQMTPAMLDLMRQAKPSSGHGGTLLPEKALTQYLALAGRFGSMARDLNAQRPR
jgi:hypothetical protein